jgi:hypothetical protein
VKNGNTVIFKGEEYKVIWIYNNGTCEIQKNDRGGKVELVAFSELTIL